MTPEERKAYNKAYFETNKEKRKAYDKAHYEANKEKRKARDKAYNEANKEKRKAWDIKRKYGLDTDAYDALIEKGCSVCGSFENLCVDHCHETLKVRGCLCNKCNVALGNYEKYILPNLDKFTKYLGGTI
jgi:hypothetical protein